MRLREKLIVLSLLAAWMLAATLRLHLRGHSPLPVLPEVSYRLTIAAAFETLHRPAEIKIALPGHTERQSIAEETFQPAEVPFSTLRQGPNRWGSWRFRAKPGRHTVLYSCTINTRGLNYRLPEAGLRSERYPPSVARYLLPSDLIQSESPEVDKLQKKLLEGIENPEDPLQILRSVYNHCRTRIKKAPFSGTTDALTCLRLGEASCGGRARLFVALLRHSGIPARIVKGVILKNRTWRGTHVWAEVFLGGRWIPFCVQNNHFAYLPARYVSLRKGDGRLFRHTPDINFTYLLMARRQPVVLSLSAAASPDAGSDASLLLLLTQVRVPLGLLKVILMIPAGVLVLVIARNIIGVPAFGTFMPVLVAVAFRDTGLGWGLILFGGIIAVAAFLRHLLEGLHLLHTPRLAVVMTAIVFLVGGVAVVGAFRPDLPGPEVTLFPLAILTLTVERFVLLIEQDGLKAALGVLGGTVCVVSAAYAVMTEPLVQRVFLVFPETLFGVAALFILLGKWRGLRLNEYLRFRALAARGGEA